MHTMLQDYFEFSVLLKILLHTIYVIFASFLILISTLHDFQSFAVIFSLLIMSCFPLLHILIAE